jgi:FAD/FMN-containing dehydrogenase
MLTHKTPLYCRRTLTTVTNNAVLRWRRSSTLSSPTAQDAHELFARMNQRPASMITTDNNNNNADSLARYNNDWTKRYQGHSSIVVRPETTEEVAALLKYCNDRRIGVVPQAGNTGLVGGSVPLNDEVILSVEKLDQIKGLEETTGILKCDAGCILQNLQDYAASRNHLVPVDLGAKGTCRIGGNVSTNAGGSYYYRYRSLHANVLGLEVVLADGRVMDMSYSAVNLKDNTGYDLKHLFIGAEGTLGVVTKVALACPRLPRARNAAFLACNTFEQVQKALDMAKTMLGEILAAFEFMDDQVLRIISNTRKLPLGDDSIYPYCILVETHGSVEEHDRAKMETFLEAAMEQGAVVDGVLSQDLGQLQDMWHVRESANPSVASCGYVYKYDVSIPVPDWPQVINEMRQRLLKAQHESAANIISFSWGHVIDGNLHFNVVSPGNFEKDESLLRVIEPFIFETVLGRGGSISAEHGLGQCKNEYLSMVRSKAELSTMYAIKDMLDPNGILNPGKYLPVHNR